MMIVAVTENSGGCSWKITVICIELEGCKGEEDWKVSLVPSLSVSLAICTYRQLSTVQG